MAGPTTAPPTERRHPTPGADPLGGLPPPALAGYTEAELELLASFLSRATDAGRGATVGLSGG